MTHMATVCMVCYHTACFPACGSSPGGVYIVDNWFCFCWFLVFSSYLWMMHRLVVQAKEALQSPYFDDLDKETVDALESDIIRAREG